MAKTQKSDSTETTPNKWDGIENNLSSKRFIYQRDIKDTDKLSREEIEKIADDPRFLLIQRKK